MTSFLTVCNLPTYDGIGSLLEYILGIYFFCDKYNLEYVHTNLKKIEHNNNIPMDEWTDFWNKNISTTFLPDVKNFNDYKGNIVELDNLYLNLIPNTLFKLNNISYLKQILNEEHTNKQLREKIITNFNNKTKTKFFKYNTINIAVHIRRYMKTDSDLGQWREYYEKGNYMDIYFQTVIKNLILLLPNCFINIFTQGDEKEFEHFKDISSSIHIHYNGSVIDDIIHLARADILVMSKGSFSRIANFYSTGVKIIKENTYPILSDKTLFISGDGNFTDEQKNIIKNIK